MDVSSVAAQAQAQVQRLVLDHLKSQAASQDHLLASAAPVQTPVPSSNLGRILDVRV